MTGRPSGQNGEDEALRIGPIRHDAFRQDRVGGAAACAPYPADGEAQDLAHHHEVPAIAAVGSEVARASATRAGDAEEVAAGPCFA